MDFSNLVKEWDEYYYMTLVMFFIELFALILSLFYARKDKIGKWFIFYIAFDFTILLAIWYTKTETSFSRSFLSFFYASANVLISLLELAVYYAFFAAILPQKRKCLLTSFFITYLLCVLIYFVTKFNFLNRSIYYGANILGALEFLFLIPPSVWYYVQLLKNTSPIKLVERPSFWIVTGIFFFSLISIPYYLLITYFSVSGYEYKNFLTAAFFYTPFTLNFLFLIKAFLCKKALTI